MKTLLFTVHGVGRQRRTSDNQRGVNLVQALEQANSDLQGQIALKSVYYIDVLQNRQERMWEEMAQATEQFGSTHMFRPARKLWCLIREIMLHTFSDATIFEHQSAKPDSIYRQTMDRLEADILAGWAQIDPADIEKTRVVLVADSLGGQVVSSYLWDMQSKIFQLQSGNDLEFGNLSPEQIRQVSLQSLSLLVTTACNIPLFVSGLKYIQGVQNNRLGYEFRWINFYDLDDLLGWPLQPLGKFFNRGPHSVGQSYADLVEDRPIKVSRNWIGRLLVGWNPVSHRDYWETPAFIEALAAELSR